MIFFVVFYVFLWFLVVVATIWYAMFVAILYAAIFVVVLVKEVVCWVWRRSRRGESRKAPSQATYSNRR